VISGKTFDSLSMALAKFNHGLISTGILSENLQVIILTIFLNSVCFITFNPKGLHFDRAYYIAPCFVYP
jgi:hypothetical protein